MTLTTILEYALQRAEEQKDYFENLMTDADNEGCETMVLYYENLIDEVKNEIGALKILIKANIEKRKNSNYSKEADFTI